MPPLRWLPAIVVVIAAAAAPAAEPLDQDTAVKLCREYLANEDPAERQALAARLATYDGPIESVLDALAARTYRPVEPGLHSAEHFVTTDLRKKHPDDLLYFVVPKTYRPDRPTGLIVFMHGGGPTTERQAPLATLRFPQQDTPPDDSPSGDMLSATGMITVGPSAPWDRDSYYRWCLRAADPYLADVILECKNRFHIDPDRVFLLGHSMGGFGAYHQALRQPDRFAAIVVNAGAWAKGYWPVIRGTPLCIVQGVHDAMPGGRWRYTDVAYARWTDRILRRENLEHVYFEHDAHHSFAFGRPKVAQYFAAAGDLRRDPYYPHVTLASPQGFRSDYTSSVRHNRWLTLDEATEGELTYDELVSHSSGTFESWRLEHRLASHRGAMIDAVNKGDNTIAVTTRNVARLTVWLHPRMVDVSKPVTLQVDGVVRFEGRVRPSLVTALDSYLRRRDWGMIYPIKIALAGDPPPQPPPPSVLPTGDKQVLADSAAVFPMEGGLVLRGYTNRRRIAESAAVAHAIVMVHGILRNPGDYYQAARAMLERKSLFTQVALVSVGFDNQETAPKGVEHLALFTDRWKHGGFGGLAPDDPENKLSSFAAMDRILRDLARAYPGLKRITLIGHSAGAQYVDRYAMLSPIASQLPGVSFRYVALAPSSVMYPSELRPQVAAEGKMAFAVPSGAKDYNEYPYGFGSTPLLEKLLRNAAADRERLIDRFLHCNITFAVGTEDTRSRWLDQSDEANTQGPNRYLRMKYFVKYLSTQYHPHGPRLLPIPGAGHTSGLLFRSPEMSQFFSER